MKSPIIFRVFKNNQIHFVKQFIDRDQIIFGSSKESAAEVDVDLDSVEISSIHCLVEKRGVQYYICDLGSSQGTFKNGQQILDEPLNSGDEFNIGPFKVVFFVGIPKPNQIQTQTTAVPEIAKPEVAAQIANVASAVVATVVPPVVTPQAAPPPVAPPTVVPPTAPPVLPKVVIPEETASAPQLKPQINAAFVSQKLNVKSATLIQSRKDKNRKTFSPGSQYQSMNQFIKPGQGGLIEVIVSWKERVLTTYHFEPNGVFKAGPDLDIQLPAGAVPANWVLIDCAAGVTVKLTPDMKAEVSRADDVLNISESQYRLQQNEVIFITLNSGLNLAIRFAPKAKPIPMDSPLILSSSEFTGILAAAIFAVFLSLIVTVLTPKKPPEEENVERIAQVIFNKPPVPVVPPPKPPVEKAPEPKPPVAQPKPPEPKKVVQVDKEKEKQNKGDPKKPDAQKQASEKAGQAQDVRPKDPNLKTKIFTSSKQGGAIKTGATNGANAKSKQPDPKNTGLLSAFGSGGARTKLDQAYNGSGEALGAGNKATGTSGFNENRAGDDLGSKFKDTGAGGKGTATQGISGLGTKGLGSGLGAGTGTGFGSKDSVRVTPGGSEEEFVGSIDREAVRRAVNNSKNFFKACYDREYKKNTKLEGKVVVSWEIHEKGIAKNVRIVKDKTTIGNSSVEECVRARMATIAFPEPPPGTFAEIVYPFLFQGEK